MLLVVAYRDLVDRYVAACKKAGIKLVGIDLEAFALLRALGSRPADAGNAAIVVVTVGSERSTLAVSNGETCEFTRVIDWGGHNLNVRIARAMDTTPSEAEAVKLSLSLLESAEAMDLDPRARGQGSHRGPRRDPAVRPGARLLAPVLPGTAGLLGIGEVVLTGGTAQLPGLDTRAWAHARREGPRR